MFVEAELTARLGDTGKRLHTARSRNDQVALDIRMYLRDEIEAVTALLEELLHVLCDLAKEHAGTVMSGYTHLQRAQPVSFGHHLMAYAQMLLRDRSRLFDCKSGWTTCRLEAVRLQERHTRSIVNALRKF